MAVKSTTKKKKLPPISASAVEDVLVRARELMNKSGAHWIKGNLWNKNKRGEKCYCSIGAIYELTKGNNRLRNAAIKALATTIFGPQSTFKYAKEGIYTWNDDSNRKWGEVSLAFRRAAKRAAQGVINGR